MEKLTKDSTIMLRNRVRIPIVGFGTGDLEENEKKQVKIIREALDAGYRHFDTAHIYHSERAIGTALRESGISRDEVFITSKVWDASVRRGPIAILNEFEDSLRRLGTDYIDLYQIHWPVQGKLVEAWKVLEQLYLTGRVRSLGIGNVKRHHFMEIMANCQVYPHVHQDEFTPYCTGDYIRYFDNYYGIAEETMMPLRRLTHEKPDGVLAKIGEKYGKSLQQVVLRWNIQCGRVIIPKSSKPHRMRQNLDIFDFQLTQEDMGQINGLNYDGDINGDPDVTCI